MIRTQTLVWPLVSGVAFRVQPGNPSITYYYDGLDRVSGIVDALSHGTNFDYNDRGQVMVTTLPWINGVRYTISNTYNSDGTLQNRTDELGHRTSYEYDDYLRLKSVTPPVRGAGDTGTYTRRDRRGCGWIACWVID